MIVKKKFICTGCGEDRPCFLEINQEDMPFPHTTNDLVCVLDATNQTSYNWKEAI